MTLTDISIHALRVEGDLKTIMLRRSIEKFLSTPSGWRATGTIAVTLSDGNGISIHALRVEGDQQWVCDEVDLENFYPRPPGGGRPSKSYSNPWAMFKFLSTPSGWRATRVSIGITICMSDFYPRPPGGGRPQCVKRLTISSLYFYPRPPGGGRPIGASCIAKAPRFLSTPSGWRATAVVEETI